MAVLTPTKLSASGVTLTGVAANVGGDKFPWSNGCFLFVKNGSGGALDVTLASQYGTGEGYTETDRTVSVGAGVEKLIGPISSVYKDTNGDVNLTYSGVTSLTVLPLTS